MEIIVYLLVFFTVTITVFFIIRILTFQRDSVKARLKELEYLDPVSEEEDEFRLSLGDRLIKPSYQKLIRFLGGAAPKNFRSQYERLMEISGSNNTMTFNRIIGLQFLLAAFLGLLFFLVTFILGKPNLLFSLCAALIGLLLPFVSLKTRAKSRQENIQNALPDMLDLIYVSVEAGLSFDMAVQRTTEKMKGPLADELKKALDEINKGKRREDALRAIVKRTEVRDLSSFVTSIIQTEQLGSNIANVLRIQSSTMRQKRRQRAEEKAMKVPVKILFPMVFFIFPPLFIVILGPVIINVVVNFL
jgi:tight adherence protein C